MFAPSFYPGPTVQLCLQGSFPGKDKVEGSLETSSFPAATTGLGTAGKKSCQERHTRLTRPVLSFPDVNECELLSGVCGEAFCENVEGSFLCVCADENQEYSPMTGQCRSRVTEGKSQWHCAGVGGYLSRWS